MVGRIGFDGVFCVDRARCGIVWRRRFFGVWAVWIRGIGVVFLQKKGRGVELGQRRRFVDVWASWA